MGKALKIVGTAIAIAGAVALTGGAVLLGGLAGTTTLFGISAQALVTVGGLVSSVGGALSQPKTSNGGQASEWTANPNGPLHFAAGRIGVAGDVVHKAAFGPNDRMYKGIVTVVSAAGPIDGWESFTANDTAVTFDGSGKANSSYYANVMWLRRQQGAQPEASYLASPSGLEGSATLTDWGSSYKLSAKAAFLLTLSENSKQSAYGGREPTVLQVIRGLKVYDPRLDSTYPGGSGAHRLSNPLTWAYSANPILWALKWSLGLWEGPTGGGAPQVDYQVGGIGLHIDNIDVASFIEAANISDANGWTVCAWPSTDDDKAQVLDGFLQAGGAYYIERAGRLACLHRSAPRASVATITGADTAGPIELDTSSSYIDRKNTGVPSFIHEQSGWKPTPLGEVSSPAWVAEDGGRERSIPVTYSFVDQATQAAQLICLGVAHTREGISARIPLRPYMQGIEPGDAFTILEADFVLDGLKCLCLETSYEPSTGVHTVTFVSESDGKYAFAYGQSPTPPAPPALTPVDPTFVSPPASGEWALAADVFTDNGASIPALVFSGAVANQTADAVVFEFRPAGVGADWAGAGVEAPTVERKEVTGLTPGTSYEGAVSYRRGNNVSARLELGPVTSGALITPSVSGLLQVTSSASSVVGFHTGAGVTTTPTVTLTVTGATGTVDVLWDNIGGELAAFAIADTSLTTAFRHTIALGATDRATFLATVTDSGTGQSTTISVGAAFVDNT